MTMTNDELRALADALYFQGRYGHETERQAATRRVEERKRAADYLRACADVQPVAWMHIDGRVISAATMDQAYRDGGAMQSSLRDYTIPLYTHPAPAASQAEPKREPLSDERIDEIGEPFGYFQYGDAQGDKRRAFIDRLTRARDEARAERDAMANVLPGHYYMDPPDGGDVPVLEQLRRMAKDAARYRFLSCKGVPPYFHRCSRWRLEYWNGEWWDPLMKEELDAAIDAQIEQERSEQAKEPK